MIRAYSEFYLRHAQNTLGNVLHQAVSSLGYTAESLTSLLIGSKIIDEFGNGNPHYVAGMSGTELLERILEEGRNNNGFIELQILPNTLLKSEEFWAGWALAYYQWYCARSFGTILRSVPLKEILSMYHPFHEMDITRFTEEMERRFMEANRSSKLKQLREINGYSQSELAELSGVKLRMIQLYEQKQNNIDKAQVCTVAKLARALGCRMEDLLDDPLWVGELMLDRKY